MEPLLLTKFHKPKLRAEIVPRPQLLELLSSSSRLTLICAPAGFGKTTLSTYWLSNLKMIVAWLSLDLSDNDSQRFLIYLISALNREDPNIGQTALDALHSPNPPAYTVLLSHLINDLAQSANQFILALDDYHSIKEKQIHDALTFLLDNLPTQLRLVIISRSEPPLPVAKLRARNHLTELDSDILRFSRPEAEIFLNKAMKLGLSGEEIAQLEKQTEGWITGLQLAALSLKANSDAGSFIQHIAGNDRHITAYLVSEIISTQPDHIQQFLLRTSILSRMTADLCNAILKISDSQNVLEEIENSNLFITPLDNKREWYRYHHLFAEVLQSQLRIKEPDRIEDLHRSAAKWFMANNMYQESIEHSLEAKDFDLVTLHLENNIDRILAEGKFRAYLNLLSRLPENSLTPSLALYQLFLMHEMGEFSSFNQHLHFVEKMLGLKPKDPADIDKETAGHFGILAIIKCIRNSTFFEIEKAMLHLKEAFLYLPEELTFWRIMAFGAEGFFNLVKGNNSLSINIFSKAASLAAKSNHIFVYFMNSINLVRIYLAYGQIGNAIQTCETLLTLIEKPSSNIPFAGLANMLMGKLLYHKDELEPAEKYIKKGIELVVKDGDAFSIASAYLTLARVYCAQNRTEEANITISQMQEVIKGLTQSMSVKIITNAYQAHIRIITGHLNKAKTWSEQPGYHYLENKQFPDMLNLNYVGVYRTGHKPLKYYANLLRLINAKLAIATNKAQEALSTLNDLLLETEQTERILFRCQILIQKSLALKYLGNIDQAVDSLISAIALVAPEPFFQIFISEGQSMQSLLEKAQKSLKSLEKDDRLNSKNLKISHFIVELLDKMPRSFQHGKRSPFDLTPREVDVLQCLDEGLTYSDSIERLDISINTFKTHIKHIYSKLNVANSTQAINKAKKLNLLDSTPLL